MHSIQTPGSRGKAGDIIGCGLISTQERLERKVFFSVNGEPVGMLTEVTQFWILSFAGGRILYNNYPTNSLGDCSILYELNF